MKLRFLFALVFLCVNSLARADESETTMQWTVDGVERKARVFFPSKPSPEGAPVIFAFHGHGGNMNLAAHGMAFQDHWPEALVVYMQGLPTRGMVGDAQGLLPGWQHNPGELDDRDLKFFDAVLARFHEKYSVDDRRIYATGFSNGGYFAYLLWAERPKVFAAFAPGAAATLPSFHLTEPRAAFHFGGTHDMLVLFRDQQRTIDEVRKLNACAEKGESCGENCTLYPSATGTPLETFIHSGAHIYPPEVPKMIVSFFRAHSRNP